jgi:SPP1 gp7 family putative phage head morphogenesis protein
VAKRRTLAEAYESTRAIKGRRRQQLARQARAKREELAPRDPTAAITAYTKHLDRYASSVERLIRKGLARGDSPVTIQAELDALAERFRRAARVMARRAADMGRKDVERGLNVKLPGKTDGFVLDLLAERNVALLRRLGADQLEAALRRGTDEQFKLVRARARLIARDQARKIADETHRQWAQAAGSEEYIWHTCRDELVRAGHGALDGTRQRWDAPPNTGRKEGHNHPGQAVSCRCRAVLIEAAEAS